MGDSPVIKTTLLTKAKARILEAVRASLSKGLDGEFRSGLMNGGVGWLMAFAVSLVAALVLVGTLMTTTAVDVF